MVDISNDYEGQEQTRAKIFDVLPAGKYIVQVVETKVLPARDASKFDRLGVTLEVIGDHEGNPAGVKGRRVFFNQNYWHGKPDVRQAARDEVKGLAFACGFVVMPKSTDELVGLPFLATIKFKEDPTYGVQNEVRGCARLPSVAPAPVWSPPIVSQPVAATHAADAITSAQIAVHVPEATPEGTPTAPQESAPLPAHTVATALAGAVAGLAKGKRPW